MLLAGVSSPPETCGGAFAGAMYYDSDINNMCLCNSTHWKEIDAITVCS